LGGSVLNRGQRKRLLNGLSYGCLDCSVPGGAGQEKMSEKWGSKPATKFREGAQTKKPNFRIKARFKQEGSGDNVRCLETEKGTKSRLIKRGERAGSSQYSKTPTQKLSNFIQP